jgi:hypothetical protein
MDPAITLGELASSLYMKRPTENLFHYTSLDGVIGIREAGGIWATKIQYFSDYSELNHAFDLFRKRCQFLLGNEIGSRDIVLQLDSWLRSPSHTASASLFVVCFTESQDSLSQWRGYTPMGRGACLELKAEHLIECASDQGFELAKCIYSHNQQTALAEQAIDSLVSEARQIGPDSSHGTASYYPAFASLQDELFRVAATFKHESFEDEKEWRAVLRLHSSHSAPSIAYRVGRTTLVPYVNFSLKRPTTGEFELWNVWVGPTAEIELSVAALRSLFGRQIRCGRYPVLPSRAPYRET